MRTIAEWLAYGLPWWAWAVPALLGVLGLMRLAGVRAGLGAAAVAAVLLAYRKGSQAGWAAQRAKGERDAQEAVDRAARARRDAERDAGDARRLRDTDGWRRE